VILAAWAARLVDELDSTVCASIAANPIPAIRDELGFKVVASQHLADRRGDGGWCDGHSFTEEGVILYRPTGSRRENFTVTHELGHVLIDGETDEDILVWSADLPDGSLELVCDQIASRLLLPSDMVTSALDGKHPSGPGAVALFRDSQASRRAVAVRLAQLLPCEGFVVLAVDGVVEFAARQGDTRPYAWEKDVVPPGHPLAAVGDGEVAVAETGWAGPNRTTRRYYMSAEGDGEWTFAVFAERDLYGAVALHLPEEERTRSSVETRDFRCPSCGYSGKLRTWSCNTCGVRACPRCSKCGCSRKEESLKRAMCSNCTKFVRGDLLVGGLCDECR
jgi:hypothetical protein